MLPKYLKNKRKKYGLTQQQLAEKAGVGIRFVRDVEQGKKSVMLHLVNRVLALFGDIMKPTPINRNNE